MLFEWIANNQSIINFVLINIALGLSIYLTLATGLLSLANAGFMAIGAYTAAVLASQAGQSLTVSFVVALVIAVLVAVPFGLAVVRLRDVYLAIATLGFVQIVNVLLLNGDKLLRGMTGNPELTVFRGAEGINLPYVAPRMILGLPETTWPLLLYVGSLPSWPCSVAPTRGGCWRRSAWTSQPPPRSGSTSSATSCWRSCSAR
jgi:branched-chain amino acid transport system permease protein